MGVQGATLVGPTGPVGGAGGAGSQGMSGQTGARGSVTEGGVGSAGLSGAQGMPGPTGPMGAQGPVGEIAHWTEYRDFTFDSGTANIRASDRNTATVIATYLASNPSLQLGIDGTMNPLNPTLSGQRVNAVRAALQQAGVPDSTILGAVNDPQFQHDGRVEILLSTR
jgi:outer membrane protein OmpA-like peptidoglycan-associated protein